MAKFYSVGVGAGDGSYITLGALRALEQADIIAVPVKKYGEKSTALEIIRKALYAQKILRAAVDKLAVNGDVVIVERCAAGAAGFVVCHYFSFTGFAMNTMVSCGSTCAT